MLACLVALAELFHPEHREPGLSACGLAFTTGAGYLPAPDADYSGSIDELVSHHRSHQSPSAHLNGLKKELCSLQNNSNYYLQFVADALPPLHQAPSAGSPCPCLWLGRGSAT